MSSTPVSPTTEDEPGVAGEVIYSSDGLEPLPITKPPVVASSTQEEKDQVLDSDSMSPQLAFELFQGKVYTTSAASSVSLPLAGKETPMQRLARLQQEVQEVEAQLKASADTATMGRDFDEALVQLATTLKTQLQTMTSSSSNTRILEHDDLTRLIHQQLEALPQPPTAATASSTTTTPETGVVYELYGNATNPTTTLEDRLVRLERAVGAGTGAKTLLARLDELESLVQTVDATTMEQAATKAKVLRADLEAASKARNKLTTTYKKEDSKMIQELHTQMVELEGLSAYLPSLVDRLQQLAGLHVQAGTFSSRLEAMETSANQLSNTVSQLEGSLDQLSDNLAQNLTTMEGNLQALDERLKKV